MRVGEIGGIGNVDVVLLMNGPVNDDWPKNTIRVLGAEAVAQMLAWIGLAASATPTERGTNLNHTGQR